MGKKTLLRPLAPAGALFVIAVFSGQSKPTCFSPVSQSPQLGCETPKDCEGLPHVACLGEWQCVQGQCQYKCQEQAGCYSDNDCPAGQHCSVSDGDCKTDPNCPMCAVCYGECVPDKCVQSGCSGEVCSTQTVFTPCVWQDWFACLKFTKCGNFGPNNTCGFEPNDAFLDCLAKFKPCKSDKDCPSGLVCLNGRCDKPVAVECTSDADCPDGYYCATETVCPPCANENPPCLMPCYLKGVCKPKGEIKGCQSDADCAWYEYCSFPAYADGSFKPANCCPPNAYCVPELPPCEIQGQCLLRPGYCWSDADCGFGERCEGVISPCPPGAYCFAAPKPGECVAVATRCMSDADCGPGMFCDRSVCLSCCTDPSEICIEACCGQCVPLQQKCTPVKPGTHGMCEMVLGWIYDGKDCVLESGCSCSPDCEAFFASYEECAAACFGQIPCESDADCPKGQICVWSGGCPPCDCAPGDNDCMCPMCVPPAHGWCQPASCSSAADCDDGNECTVDRCVGGVCDHEYLLGCGWCKYDKDGDGYYDFCNPGDCDDNNPNVYPGAKELCDGIDNDCDGLVDEDCGYIPCKSDADCGPNMKCDKTECLSCCLDPSQPCIALCCGKCVPIEKACQSDLDCPTGQYCELRFDPAGSLTGKCAPLPPGACVRDADCGFGGKCEFGPCPLCFPCPCFGTCVYGNKCQAHSDCPAGKECRDGQCVALPDGMCWLDKDCPQGFYCDIVKCGSEKCLGPYYCVAATPKCIRTGCSGEVCSSEPVMTPCWYLPWFECLKYTECGNYGPDGSCAFLQTPEFLECLSKYGR